MMGLAHYTSWWSLYLQLYSIAVWCLPLPLPCGAGNIAHQPRIVWHDDYRPENTQTPQRDGNDDEWL